MNLEHLAARLASKGCGVTGKTIFVTEMPASCTQGILLIDPHNGTRIDHELPDYYVTEFRTVVRSPDFNAGFTLASKASASLKSVADYAAGPMIVKQCLPLNLPRAYRRSVGGYWEFEVDVGIVFVEKAA